MTRRRCRAPPARTIARSARASRPWRPITLPTSSFATWRRRTTASSRSSSSTLTASGSSTSWRARYATRSANVLDLEQTRDRLRRLRPLAEPLLDLVLVELDRRRIGLRVVAPDDLDESPVPRRARVGDDDAVDRVLLRPDPRQPHLYRHLAPFICVGSIAPVERRASCPSPSASSSSASACGPPAAC